MLRAWMAETGTKAWVTKSANIYIVVQLTFPHHLLQNCSRYTSPLIFIFYLFIFVLSVQFCDFYVPILLFFTISLVPQP